MEDARAIGHADTPTRQTLTPERVVEAAVELADAEGLGKLTMRRLAAALGFEVMSLYNHVANKKALLEAMVDRVAAEIERPEGPWDHAIRASALSNLEALQRHPWAVAEWNAHLPGPNRCDLMEWQLRVLAKSPLDDDLAHQAFHAWTTHVLGYAMQVASMPEAFRSDPVGTATQFRAGLDPLRHEELRLHVDQHLRGDEGRSFELVLDFIIDGFRRS
jgi:AcrR family transcriptional regulator